MQKSLSVELTAAYDYDKAPVAHKANSNTQVRRWTGGSKL